MSGTSAPKKTSSEARDDGDPPPRSDRRLLSVLGLSVVSGLNVACLAFIAYHLAAHPQKSTMPSSGHTETSEIREADASSSMQPPPAATPGVLGNVDLAPTSRDIISIASGFDLMDREPVDHQENASMTSAEDGGSAEATSLSAGEPLDHWVQLGALSKEATARRYWSGLKLRYTSLLQEREPRYFGPSEVDGGLYHIRLGPMAADAAAGLCERLEAEGADCFRVIPDGNS